MGAALEFLLPGLAIALFGVAAVTDARHRRISNRLSACLALVGIARIATDIALGASPVTAACDFAAAALVFGLGAVAFRYRVLGGGDVKLLAAGALWLGCTEIGPFLLATAIAGGLLALIFVGSQIAFPGRKRSRLPGLPYAVAIAAGGILTTAFTALG